MKTFLLAILVGTSSLACAADKAAKPSVDGTAYREPFTLTLHIDHDHSYKKKFGKTPYVLNGEVYLFKGDDFGVDLDIQGNAVRAVKYQPNVKAADVQVNFVQEIEPDGMAMMMLHISNNTNRTLTFDVSTTVPGKKEATKTNVVPVRPGAYELVSWPHPVVKAVLQDIRIVK